MTPIPLPETDTVGHHAMTVLDDAVLGASPEAINPPPWILSLRSDTDRPPRRRHRARNRHRFGLHDFKNEEHSNNEMGTPMGTPTRVHAYMATNTVFVSVCAALALLLSSFVIGFASDVLGTFRAQKGSNPWWLPIWSAHFDDRGLQAVVGTAVCLVVIDALVLGLLVVPLVSLLRWAKGTVGLIGKEGACLSTTRTCGAGARRSCCTVDLSCGSGVAGAGERYHSLLDLSLVE
ncbi:hypothetical protein ANO11243_087970 [Dothideomycetidae sp. 11243]|nr:hypothetical protein ANO11243_087970 [fungal sp. No.11243]